MARSSPPLVSPRHLSPRHLSPRHLLLVTLAAAAAWPFLWATTFFGDDHLFLAFARLEPHPLSVLWQDKHGGEYWRPLPMLLWWLLGRAGLGAMGFGLVALALHAGLAALVARLGQALGFAAPAAALAGWLFFVAPGTRDVGLWFSASTDLLAATFVVAAILLLLRGRAFAAAATGTLALLSKESAVVLPLLAWAALAVSQPPASLRQRVHRVAPLALLTGAYLAARLAILAGPGGAGEASAAPLAKSLQILAGLGWVLCPDSPLGAPVAALVGLALVGLATFSAIRARAREGAPALAPLWWVALAVMPLLAAGWAVGARYFYLPAVGLAWLAAAALGRRSGEAGRLLALLALTGLGSLSGAARLAETQVYRAEIGALRDHLDGAVARGTRHFVVQGGIKDLDLMAKAWPELQPHAANLLLLGDVPASFLLLPSGVAEEDLAFLLARPPLPPSGAYRFGGYRIAAQARRGQEPDLDRLWRTFPDLRILRLRPPRPGQAARIADVTAETRDRGR